MLEQTIKEMKQATPLKLISIISDFATIIGVSIGTLVAGPLLGQLTGMGFNLSDFLWAVFFYFLFISVFAIAFTGLAKHAFECFKRKNYKVGILSISGNLLLVALVITSFPNISSAFGSVSGSRYLLPPKPTLVNATFESVTLEKHGSMHFIKGNVAFDELAEPKDYTVALYTMNKDTGEYDYNYFGLNKVNALLNSNGDFTMPKVKLEAGEAAYLAVYLIADKSSGMGSEFPNKLTQIPSRSMDEFGVITYDLSLNNDK